MNPTLYRPIIATALAEDIHDDDLTGQAIFNKQDHCQARLIAKQDGIVAGLAVFKETFLLQQFDTQVTLSVEDGDAVEKGQIIAEISGSTRAVLVAERVALNLLQRMSGIASLTRQFVDLVPLSCGILDTRKTAPNLRILDKWAVRLGGGMNHRMGLYDMAMLKENHIKSAGGIQAAVKKLHDSDHHRHPIEVEVQNLTELKQAMTCDVDRIMLDNMSLSDMQQAVKIINSDVMNGKIPLEASGNVNLTTVADIAATGVDYISVGALTHSVNALDFSLLVV